MRIAPPTEEEILRAQVSSYKKIQSDGYPLSREEKDVIANFDTNLNELQAKNVKKVRVLIRDESKKLAMTKKDKDKLKTDSTILKDLANGMLKARKNDEKRKGPKEAN